MPGRSAMYLLFCAIAADSVLVFHWLFALFAVLGGLLVPVAPEVIVLHIPVVLWSSLVNLANWTCPLTPLEAWLRQLAGQPSFKTTWVQQYIEPLVRPLGMPRSMELIAGISIIVWNLLVYAVLWFRQ